MQPAHFLRLGTEDEPHPATRELLSRQPGRLAVHSGQQPRSAADQRSPGCRAR